jgi:hypothetical protein
VRGRRREPEEREREIEREERGSDLLMNRISFKEFIHEIFDAPLSVVRRSSVVVERRDGRDPYSLDLHTRSRGRSW